VRKLESYYSICLDLSKQIIFDHFLQEVKAIRTAGSNADWQL
jgi:hypothetical protein